MPKNFLTKTLAELLAHKDPTIYRNSMSILKTLQRLNPQDEEGVMYCELHPYIELIIKNNGHRYCSTCNN